MWTYDGEQWTEEGTGEREKKPELGQLPEERFEPELQVIEIIPRPKTHDVPPLPIP